MYKCAKVEEELAMFNGVWTTVWKEKGYEIEFSEHVLESIIVINEQEQAIGSAEIKQYYPDARSDINSYAPFLEHEWVKHAGRHVGECDKVALLKGYRGQANFTHALLSSICDASKRNRFVAMVSLLEPSFMKALKKLYHVPMEEVGAPFYYKGATVIPVVMNVYYVYSNLDKFSWYIKHED